MIPVAFNNREIPVGASVGVSLYPHDGASAAELVRAADLAMYHGKGSGRNDVRFFSADMKSGSEARHRIDVALRGALDNDELFLVYQPRVAMDSNRVAGFEALLRWRHPDQGVLLPAQFLAEAEESGVIVPIGQRVLDQACTFAAQLRAAGYDDLPVAINVSHREYSQPGFLACLTDRLARHRLPPHSVQLDLRIDSLVRHPALGQELAEQLRGLGVALSVDGFGAAPCDLAYLQRLGAGLVKLAPDTVQALGDGGQAVAKSLIDIAHNLDMAVVAEAVETRPQLDFLKSHGCDQFQGFWFSEPLGAEAARRMLQEQQPA
jgi:EAL domain-containing protein (putative c-di-GMP-specific phosphodiesterase class I)